MHLKISISSHLGYSISTKSLTKNSTCRHDGMASCKHAPPTAPMVLFHTLHKSSRIRTFYIIDIALDPISRFLHSRTLDHEIADVSHPIPSLIGDARGEEHIQEERFCYCYLS